ncbi:transcription factor 7-like 1 isoform X2 [Phyllopteryx taeniolatus]|uniref:transcription factor 7-like 1 isoform X2 n=1 Tax=Phyllopteryx taeniolatus TaxID=161469 RepID=UPI002AD58CD4|nr:transcription factor 7-like 1 isoform X2 [Phyllopteryx taeniolatus]
MTTNVEWDFNFVHADMTTSSREQVSGASMVVSQMPFVVINGQLFYQLAPASFFVPLPAPPPPPPPPPKTRRDPSKRKRNKCTEEPTRPYIKKPPNAFMLFMKEQRPVVKAKIVNKDSATLNKVLGKLWKSLALKEQLKYFRESERLSQIHASMYPDWTCRDNYGKKKKRMWGSAATRLNGPTMSAPELPHAPSACAGILHEGHETDLTSQLLKEPEAQSSSSSFRSTDTAASASATYAPMSTYSPPPSPLGLTIDLDT